MTDDTDDVAKTLGLDGRPGRSKLFVVLILLLIAGGGSIWYFLSSHGAGGTTRYSTTEVVRDSFEVTVTATGTVEPTNLVEISSELSGTLETVEVDYNDSVDIGTVLATLDTTKLDAQVAVSRASLDAAIARVAMAQATLEEAREKYEAARELDAVGATPHQSFVTQQAAFRRAQAELQSAHADQALASANLDLHMAELDNACICSPIRGIVLERAVDPGQIVAAALSAPVLFTIAEDLTQMELRVDIDEADIGRVRTGNMAEFTVDAYDDLRFPAEISKVRFAPETIEGVVTYKAVLTIDNSDLFLRPGMTATADIVIAEVRDSLVVPNAALRYAPPAETEADLDDDRSGLLGMLIPEPDSSRPEGDERTVWVLRDGVPTEVPVETGDSNQRVTAIVGGDLTEGDLVITDQQNG